MLPWLKNIKAPTVANIELPKVKPPEIKEFRYEGEVIAPKGKSYKKYQIEGINYALSHSGTILADEMGLGKTIQAIGVINTDESIKNVLIICPASLKLNWRNELNEWLARSMMIHILPKDIPTNTLLPNWGRIVIINYDILHKLNDMDWDLVILDESHYIKNDKSKRTREVKRVCSSAKKVILMTGTPILNRPFEIWTMLQVAAPAYWDQEGLYKGKRLEQGQGAQFFRFAKRYCNAKRVHHGKSVCNFERFGKCSSCHWDFHGASNLEELNQKLKESCVIRRTKTEVLPELPDKQRQIIVLENNEPEDGLEDLDVDNYDEQVRGLRSTQIAFEKISTRRHEQGIKKIGIAVDHIEGLLSKTDKVVVFAHHQDVIAGLYEGLKHHGAVCITGNTPMDERQDCVDIFQDDPNCRVFIGSIMASGTGFTLHSAHVVVFTELDWTPGNMSQAEDRVHRIGQEHKVLIQHLVYDGTIDAKIAKVLVKKQEIISRAIE